MREPGSKQLASDLSEKRRTKTKIKLVSFTESMAVDKNHKGTKRGRSRISAMVFYARLDQDFLPGLLVRARG